MQVSYLPIQVTETRKLDYLVLHIARTFRISLVLDNLDKQIDC